MKQIQFHETGRPEDVVQCVDVAKPVLAAADDVLVSVRAFSINPADLLTMWGFYPRSDPHSPALGIEAAGVVEAAGRAVTNVAAGDRVILLSGDNWSERRVVKADQVVRASADIDFFQLAGLKVNPATAALLLKLFVELRPGDWFLQNAANSSVGRAAIQIARSRHLRTVNVVRRESAVAELRAIGADRVVIDSDDLARDVATATWGGEIKLAADAVAGTAAGRLAACLVPHGSLVVFGAMSGEAPAVNPGFLVFQDVSLHGFWLTRYLRTAPLAEIVALYRTLEGMLTAGELAARIDSVFQADDIKAAVRRAGESGRTGKVVVTFT
jgi:NADPH:quinone reductase-like Zn-dependent oxidoreductase